MRVGILGGGQLARMMAIAGRPLGIDFSILEPADDACSAAVATHLHGAYDNQRLLEMLSVSVDVVTYEFENVSHESLIYLQNHCPAWPPINALETTQDRLSEKQLFTELGIDTPKYYAVDSQKSLDQAVDALGLPAVIKTRHQGYDGKGQLILERVEDVAQAWQSLGEQPAILEAFVHFDRELSIIAVRAINDDVRFYSLVENAHTNGILWQSRPLHQEPLQKQAEEMISALIRHFDYVGVLALELFQVGDQLLANEYAPRVHNSGHWTIEGAETSQFENHIRAVLELPLGSTALTGFSQMHNCIGEIPTTKDVLQITHAHLHDYQKQPRPGRKLGHITVHTNAEEEFNEAVTQVSNLIGQPVP